MMLADLGARVVKIERPEHGDDSRQVGPFLPDGTSIYNFYINRNKQSIALDLTSLEDLTIARDLINASDVLVENFTPGTMEKLGLGYEAARQLNPKLIYASISGFGQTGPLREAPAYDIIVQAMGGIMSLTGQAGGEPTRVGVSIGDIAAGMFATSSILAALHARRSNDTGTFIDISMLDSQLALLENAFARFQISGKIPEPIGSRHPSITPFGVFKAKDGRLVIGAANNSLVRKLFDAVGRPDLINDPRFATNDLRCNHITELTDALETALKERPCVEWIAHFASVGVPSGPLNNVAEIMKSPQVRERGMLREMTTPDGSSVRLAASPMRIGSHDPHSQPFTPAPALNSDRELILADLYSTRA